MSNRAWQVFGIVTGIGVVAFLVMFFVGRRSVASPTAPLPVPAVASVTPPPVTEVVLGTAYAVQHTFRCVLQDGGGERRDWHLTDRWVRNQLSFDDYVVDGRTFRALRIVTDDPTLALRQVRFRKVRINMSGPSLEGHDYNTIRLDGTVVELTRDVLLVEFNGALEVQRRPLPPCGMPRS